MSSLEQDIIKEGLELFKNIKDDNSSLFNTQYWSGRLIEWAIKDHDFKVDLFRFVDVLPVLSTNEQISSHLNEYLLKKDRDNSFFLSSLLKAASSFGMAKAISSSLIKKNITQMANRFILGENAKDAAYNLKKITDQGFLFTLDILGEMVLSENEADSYINQVYDLIKEASPFENANISIKISSLSSKMKQEAPDYCAAALKEKIMPLLRFAKEKNVFINFDAESYKTLDITKKLFHEIILSPDFKDWPSLGIVIQAYLKQSPSDLNELFTVVKKRFAPITVRLVKGAYWDYETTMSEQLTQNCPVFEIKSDTDFNYEHLSKLLIDNHKLIKPAFGSHNIRSLTHAICYARHKGLSNNDYEIQMLFGMAQAERKALLKKGHQVRVYCPVGEMLPGMSYLVRRLLENTSQMGFVKMAHYDHKEEELLVAPKKSESKITKKSQDFYNFGLADFTLAKERDAFKAALENIQKKFPVNVPLIIDGKNLIGEEVFERINPNKITQTITRVNLASIAQAQQAVVKSHEAKNELKNISLSTRALHLINLSKLLKEDKYNLAAAICFEVGKPWADSYADVSEAIDFCEYYASIAFEEIGPKDIHSPIGEKNTLSYEPRGISVIISPWNFPLAILCGMSVAVYLAGNPIILKPAEQSCFVAYLLYEKMIKAGLCSTAIQFLPARGETVGRYLVNHPLVANICFTGSKEVGLEILKNANVVSSEQSHIKHVICEMGGKNTIIIDDDADIDEAVLSCVKSAFDFSGQKCSALSRLVLVGEIQNIFKDRFINCTKTLSLTASTSPKCDIGPVVDEDAFNRLTNTINKLKNDPQVKVLYEGKNSSEEGFFIPPLIIETQNPLHFAMQEEFFGPIVVIFCAKDLTEAIKVANNTSYALTGGFFSRSPNNIALVKKDFLVGNLYVNQKCTGAFVQRQPFGGFKLSGAGSKAGGKNYLSHFVDAKVITENTMRRGFSPEISV